MIPRIALLALLAISAAASDLDVDLVVPFASHHWHRNGQSEFNPGAGLSVGLPCGDWTPFAQAALYRDSYRQLGQIAVVGVRYDVTTWLGAELGAGYLCCSTYEGPMAFPGIYVGFDRVRLHCDVLGTRSLGFSMRTRL